MKLHSDQQNIWFTSDTHFGHANIIKYCDRPFESTEEMDEELIENWNMCVSDDDIIFHLGDFCFGNTTKFLGYITKLNGHIKLLMTSNHHDRWINDAIHIYPLMSKSSVPVELVFPIYDIEIDGHPVTLCHYPIQVWNKKHYLSYHLYGHVHDHRFIIPDAPLSYNVGVDINEYTPVDWEHIQTIMYERIDRFKLKPIQERE